MKRYSNPDTIQKTMRVLRDAGVLTADGQVRATASLPNEVHVPEPFKLDQRLKPQTIAEIIARYEAGEPSTAIAAAFNLNKGSVIRLLREAGVTIRNQGLTKVQITEAAQLYQSGLSLAAIGVGLGVDHSTVHRQLLRRDVKMRDTHGRAR